MSLKKHEVREWKLKFRIVFIYVLCNYNNSFSSFYRNQNIDFTHSTIGKVNEISLKKKYYQQFANTPSNCFERTKSTMRAIGPRHKRKAVHIYSNIIERK